MQSILQAARTAGRTMLSEPEAKALAAQAGLRVPRSATLRGEDEIEDALRTLGPPFVLKAMASTLVHKSDAGGVRLHLRDAAQVREALRAMRAEPRLAAHELDGFLLEEMAPRGHEFVIGGSWHPHFGPVVMAGLGGIFVEVFADVAFRICPIERIDAEEMIAELRGARVLDGARGGVVASRSALVDALMAVGGADGLLSRAGGEIVELDLNPVIVDAAHATAVDARVVLRAAA